MEKIEAVKELLNISTEQQVFYLSLFTTVVLGLALYVVLVALRIVGKRGEQ